MEKKQLDLSKSVYELCDQYPELKNILAGLGFHDIMKPGMLTTAGRFMTLPKGALLKKITLDSIIKELLERGFHVI